tara:strand:+ start:106 stop:477 length:372 start_codon:yes stop_codon:yes gene_type:complete
MKMWKIPVITTDDVVADNFIFVDASTLQDVTVGATTTVFSGLGWVLTFTFDGTNAAEKLLNANLMANYLTPLLLDYNGNDVNRKEAVKIFELWKGLSTPDISALTGIEKTGDLGNAIVTLALS